jgi:two-component system, cell cycle sensor histidine kinase and response regulator CckA
MTAAWLLLLVLLWLPSASASGADTVRVGIYDNKPLVFQDASGQARGLFVDTLKAIATRKNWNLDFVYGSWSDCLARLERGEIDLLAAIAYSEARAERFDYTYETVITNWGEIYGSKAQPIESILDLAGKRIGVKQGDIHFEALRRLTSEFGIQCRFIEGDGYEMVFEMINNDFVPLGVVNHLYGRENQAEFEVVSTPVVFNPIEVKFAALKGRHLELLFAIDNELARLKQRPGSAYHRSLERWLMTDSEAVTPRWILSLAFVGLIGLIILLCGNLLLRHRVNLRTKELSDANKRLHAEVNERLLIEEELRKSEKVVAASSDAMALLDPRGVFLTVNPVYLELLGKSRPEVIGHHLDDVYPAEFLEDTIIPQLYACMDGRVVRFQVPWPHAGEVDEIEAEVTCSPYYNQEGRLNGVLLNIRDITENQKLAAQLKQAQKMEAIGTLAGGVAHDLNNILSGLVGYPDLILMDLPPDSPHLKSVMVIKNSGERAAAIVQDLLTLARRGVDQRKPVELNTIIRGFLASPENQYIQKLHPEVVYRVDLAPRPLMLIGSDVHLAKTIMNLVTNAVEAMPDGGELFLSTRYAEQLQGAATTDNLGEHGYARIEVGDTGTGIAPEDRERIFEPFYTRKVMGRSGTGLGMAVVWGTVSDHGGQIQVESQVGEGTRFIIQLPLSEVAVQVPVPQAERLPTGNGEQILVVDDEVEQRLLANELLTRLDYQVTTAANGEEALEVIRTQAFDLVIMDMIMPGGMDGLDTYQAIRAIRPDQMTIIVSGYSESERVKAAQLLGAGTYLRKPYTVEELGGAIHAILNKSPNANQRMAPVAE